MVEFADFNHGPKETQMTNTTLPLIELLRMQDDGLAALSAVIPAQAGISRHFNESPAFAAMTEKGEMIQLVGWNSFHRTSWAQWWNKFHPTVLHWRVRRILMHHFRQMAEQVPPYRAPAAPTSASTAGLPGSPSAR